MLRLIDAISVLASHNVIFVLIGGMAIRSHGSAYLTEDLDICFSRNNANLSRIVQALAPLKPRLRGFPKELPFIWDESTLRNGTFFTLETSLCNIDLLAEVPGIGPFDAVLAESIPMEIAGHEIRVLSIDGLIKAKKTANRVKDQLVLPELEALKAAIDENEE